MKKIVLTLAFLTSLVHHTFAQKEVNLLTLNKPIDGFNRQGSMSVYSRQSSSMIPRIMMVPAEDGVVVKAEYALYKFGPDNKKQWEVELPKVFKLFDIPYMKIVSDAEGTYVLEVKTNYYSNEKVAITRINAQGKMTQGEYSTNINKCQSYDLFTLQGTFCALTKDVDQKSKRLSYTLYTIDKSDGKFSEKKINLPTDEYEYKHNKPIFDRTASASKEYYWNRIGTTAGKAILAKSYFREEAGQKAKRLVIQLLEIGADGSMSAPRDVYFEPSVADADRKFISPTITYHPKDNSITVAGFMEINKNRLNGLYLLKYDYATTSLTYKHEHHFDQLLKRDIKPSIQAHYQIPERVNTYYPLDIRDEDLQYDDVNNFINLRIVTDFDLNSYTFFEVKFDQYGDHIQTSISDYRQAIHLFGNVFPKPTFYQLLWKDKTRPHVAKSKMDNWDYINSRASDNKKEDIYYVPLPTSKGNRVVYYNQNAGKFNIVLLD